ncbi:MAG: hypothetical protein AAF602_26375, partial [Myxococcota bacterium]
MWWLVLGCAGEPSPPTGDGASPTGETSGPGTAQRLVDCGSDVLVELTDAARPGRGSEGYPRPDAATRDAFAASMRAVLADDAPAAEERAAAAGYAVCRSGDLVRWRSSTTGAPAVILRTGGAAGLVVGAPHPSFDTSTLEESAVIFAETRARALIAAGSHRCANATPSACSGQTSVCSDAREAYPESDMAHVVDSIFQVAHEVLLASFPDDLVISVHGMAGDGVSLSDGPTAPTTAQSVVARLAGALATELPDQIDGITSCNDYP